jgi:hypothetical protein
VFLDHISSEADDLSVDQLIDRLVADTPTMRDSAFDAVAIGNEATSAPVWTQLPQRPVPIDGLWSRTRPPGTFREDVLPEARPHTDSDLLKCAVRVLKRIDDGLAKRALDQAAQPATLPPLPTDAAGSRRNVSERPIDGEDRDAAARGADGEPAVAPRLPSATRAIAIAIAVLLTALVVGWIRFGEKIAVGRRDAQAEATASAVIASREAVSRLDALQRDVTLTRDEVQRVHAITDLLVAPDVLRFAVSGAAPNVLARATGFFSPSRGVLFTAASLPQPTGGLEYTVWLLTAGDAVSVGGVRPDPDGRATLVSSAPAAASQGVIGMAVTLGAAAPGTSPETPYLTMLIVPR